MLLSLYLLSLYYYFNYKQENKQNSLKLKFVIKIHFILINHYMNS